MGILSRLFSTPSLGEAIGHGSVRSIQKALSKCSTTNDVNKHVAQAAYRGVDVLKLFVKHGADLNYQNPDFVVYVGHNATPLHAAVRVGNTSVVRFLLDNKVNLNVEAEGGTPLDYAENNRFDIAGRSEITEITSLLNAHHAVRSKKKEEEYQQFPMTTPQQRHELRRKIRELKRYAIKFGIQRSQIVDSIMGKIQIELKPSIKDEDYIAFKAEVRRLVEQECDESERIGVNKAFSAAERKKRTSAEERR